MEADNQHKADLNTPFYIRQMGFPVSNTPSQPVHKWVGKMCKDVVGQDTQCVWQTAHTVLSPSLRELRLPGCKHSHPVPSETWEKNSSTQQTPALPQPHNMQGISAGDSGTPTTAWELLHGTAHTTESSGMAGRIMEENSCGVRNHNSSAYAEVGFQESHYLSSDVWVSEPLCLFYWLSTWLYCCL